jgi:hypothetical protein
LSIDEAPDREPPKHEYAAKTHEYRVASMDELESLNHTKWECKYHVVFIPQCRRKTLYMQLRQYLGEVFRKLAEQKESRIEEGHLMSDHVHMMISIPPEIRRVAGGRLHQGEECHPLGAHLWRAPAEFRWAKLLGARVFPKRRRGWIAAH